MSRKPHIRIEETTISPDEWFCRGPVTFGWDSATGEVWGTVADKLREEAHAAHRRGYTYTIHPIPGGFTVPIRDPFHDPGEIAALLEQLNCRVPEVLQPFLYGKTRRQRLAQRKLEKRANKRGGKIVY